MDFDEIIGRIGKLFFFISTLFIVSISLAGILYTDSFARTLGFNFSMFDVNSYTFFTQVLISDQYQVLGNGVVALTFIISFFCAFPRSLLLVSDLLYLVGLFFILLLPRSFFIFLLLVVSPFFLPFFLILITVFAVFVKVTENNFIMNGLKKVNLKLVENGHYKKIKIREQHTESSYLKATIMFVMVGYLVVLWLSWIVGIGAHGKKHADLYLKSQEYKSIQLIDKTKLNGVLVTKVKNGYLFVLKENNKDNLKASFIPDNVIFRID